MINKKLKIDINKLNSLKITKVAFKKIFFSYDNEKYFIHESRVDYEIVITIYKRVKVNDDGYYKVDFMANNSKYIRDIKKLLKYPSTTLVYNQIDKEYFVKQLEKHGLCKILV